MDYTVRQSNRVIKQLSRQALRGHYIEAAVLLLILRVFTAVPSLVVDTFAPDSGLLAVILDMYNIIMSGPVNMVTVLFFLAQFRNIRLGLNALPAGFSNWSKSFFVYMLMSIKIALWSLLFVIPGIFAAIRYSQAFYILADHPEYSPMQCIEASKAMMRPNMGRYILLRLSYLPWLILAGIPSGIYTSTIFTPPALVMNPTQYVTELRMSAFELGGNPIVRLLGLLTILVTVYIEMGCACFYDIAAGKLVFSTGEDDGYSAYEAADYEEVDYTDADYDGETIVNADYEEHRYGDADSSEYSEDNWNDNIR